MIRLTARAAKTARGLILASSIGGLAMVFQPFSQALFGAGCILVFLSAISFNLMPFLQTGKPLRGVRDAAAIVLTVLAVLVLLAALSANGYVLYLQAK